MKKIVSMLGLAMTLAGCSHQSSSEPSIYEHYHAEAQKIYGQMTLDQKIGQLIQPSYILLANAASKDGKACKAGLQNSNTLQKELIKDCGLDQIATYQLGSVLSGGGPFYNEPSLVNWQKLNALAKQVHQQGVTLDPLLLIGNDAVHGNMHVEGAVIFPHNIGLGVTHDAELIQKIGYLTGQDSLASGFNWVFSPMVAVPQDIRWGRTYESFASTPALVKQLGAAYIVGAQNIQDQQIHGVLATAKHFIGDGATQFGLDEGDDQYQGKLEEFWQQNGQGYEGAVNANVGSIMVSYSAIAGNTTRMHFGGLWNILNKFKGAGIAGSDGKIYEFDGIAISDWNGATRAAYFYNQATQKSLGLPEILAKSFNAGVDIFMLGQGDRVNLFDSNSPADFTEVGQVFNALKTAYQTGMISDQRLQDAVTRILAVKLAMAKPATIDYAKLQAEERRVALQAAEESLVLLKNQHQVLPVKRTNIKNVVFVGPANDLGLQNGGWTVNWQGQKGNQYFTGRNQHSSGAVTIVSAVKNLFHGQAINYFYVQNDHGGLPAHLNPNNTIVIAVLSEAPYAEYMGDIANGTVVDEWYKAGASNNENLYLRLPQSDSLALNFNEVQADTLAALHKTGIKVITIVYSGRPVVLSVGGEKSPWQLSDVVIAAFLPGTLGGKAVANAIFGEYHFRVANHGQSNTLTYPWPRDMADVTNLFKQGALFDISYGLPD